ncbi:MAG: DUF2924 domain-containing protein [Planctomycetota bacterium]
MNPNVSLDDLQHLPRHELDQGWAQQIGGRLPPKIKLLLVRDLAWDTQQTLPGGLDADTQALLNAAVRSAKASADQNQSFDSKRSAQEKTKRRRSSPRFKPQLQAGAKLHRTWRGHTYEVEVLEPGKRFGFRGQTYTSLTQIARKITGAHWSGPRFFGLNRVRSLR